MEKYLVAWVTRRTLISRNFGNKKTIDKDHYKVFVDGNDNEHEAYKFYKKLINDHDVYSANITKIIESTDY